MNREDIIRMAREAGDDWDHTLPKDRKFLIRFAALVAAAEREICFMPDEEFTSETGANARLLAAAPDLLKALEDMVICFERFEDTHTALVMEAARIALGKAVGKKK